MVLTDDAGIRAVNRGFLDRDEPTDVISFRYNPLPGESPALPSGEVVVNAQRAAAVGRKYGGIAREVALYLAHGFDHLAGADDASPGQRARMRQRELRWLRAAHRLKLFPSVSLCGRREI